MALRNQGKQLFADAQADIPEALLAYSKGSYPASRFADAICVCGCRTFLFATDDENGAAERQCTACESASLIANSAEVEEEMELVQSECTCEGDVFELTLGLAVYTDEPGATRWIYVGARCVECSLVGCYVDWKCDGDDVEALLANA